MNSYRRVGKRDRKVKYSSKTRGQEYDDEYKGPVESDNGALTYLLSSKETE